MTYFLAFTAGLVVHGAGDLLTGRRTGPGDRTRRGVVWIGLAAVHAAAWALLPLAPFDGIAIPELIGTATLWAWVGLTYRSLRNC